MINLTPSLSGIDMPMPEKLDGIAEDGDISEHALEFTSLIAQFANDSLQQIDLQEPDSLDLQEEAIDITASEILAMATEIPLSDRVELSEIADKDTLEDKVEETSIDEIDTIALQWINMVSYATLSKNGETEQSNAAENSTAQFNTKASSSLKENWSEKLAGNDKQMFSSENDDLLASQLTSMETPITENSGYEEAVKPMQPELTVNSQPLFTKIENQNATSIGMKTVEIMPALTEPEWGNHFSQQILWLGQQQIDKAVIRIHPEELGPLEVKLQILEDSIGLSIQTTNQPVSHLLEQTMPRLREMMLEQGITLSQVSIETNTNTNPQNRFQQNNEFVEATEANAVTTENEILVPVKVSQGLIDYFA